MALSILALVVSLAVVGTQAGSFAFQPALQPPRMRSLRSNATIAHGHDKRWVGTEHGTDANQVHLWPNKEVKYAFDNDESQSKLLYIINMALADWDSSGLKADEFKWTKISKDDCMKDRNKCLLISANSNSRNAATVGINPISPASPEYVGPTLELDEGMTVAGLQPESIFAHEIGHVWGLIHEHQNPAFWPKRYQQQYQFDGKVFGEELGSFNCKAINGYAEAEARARAAPNPAKGSADAEAASICVEFWQAVEYGFAGFDFLPRPGIVAEDMTNMAQTVDNVDWESIMLYSSLHGGDLVLTKPDGDLIIPFPKPSGLDVQGIQKLYGGTYALSSLRLLNQPSNTQNAAFKKIACST